jgi:hypothetical protein
MYGKQIIQIFFIFLLTVLQLSFVDNLPGPVSGLNVILIMLIFSLVLDGLDKSMPRAFTAGLFFGLFSFAPFGVHLISLCIFIFIMDLLVVHFFTNRSVYSFLMLALISTILYGMLFGSISLIFALFAGKALPTIAGMIDLHFLLDQLLCNVAAVLIIFYLMNYFSNKLRPAFLLGGKE